MRVLVVSDVHSNLVALEAVLADAQPFDRVWSLGDIVGYGPEPNRCIALLSEYDHLAIAGNHDWGVLGRLDLSRFNAVAKLANQWNRDQLDPSSHAYLSLLETIQIQEQFTTAHGSPRSPIWEYIMHTSVALANFEHFDTPVCLVGHTHIPIMLRLEDEGELEILDPDPTKEPIDLSHGRHIINPGSVGQPRDGDPRAAYALVDTEAMTIQFRRVVYDIAQTQQAMREAGLPDSVASRLESGW